MSININYHNKNTNFVKDVEDLVRKYFRFRGHCLSGVADFYCINQTQPLLSVLSHYRINYDKAPLI